jgi:hypothetical protein
MDKRKTYTTSMTLALLLFMPPLTAERVYEFLFIFTPVPFKGAAGSPGRPLAIR